MSRRLARLAHHLGPPAEPASASMLAAATAGAAGGAPVLQQEDHDFFEANGYLVIPAVPVKNADRVKDETWEFLAAHNGMHRDRPATWTHSGMVLMQQTQGVWENRQHPRVYGAFAELLGRRDLWCSFDMMTVAPPLNPPPAPGEEPPPSLHWDLSDDVVRGKGSQHLRLQGEIVIEDCLSDGEGGFTTVPGWVRHHEAWVAAQPADEPIARPELQWREADGRWVWPEAEKLGLEVVQVRARAGSLLIWCAALGPPILDLSHQAVCRCQGQPHAARQLRQPQRQTAAHGPAAYHVPSRRREHFQDHQRCARGGQARLGRSPPEQPPHRRRRRGGAA